MSQHAIPHRWSDVSPLLINTAAVLIGPIIATAAIVRSVPHVEFAALSVALALGNVARVFVEGASDFEEARRTATQAEQVDGWHVATPVLGRQLRALWLSLLLYVVLIAMYHGHPIALGCGAIVLVGTALQGMSLAWYFLARSAPRVVLRTEGVIRLPVLVLTALLSMATDSTLPVAIGLLAAPVAGVGLQLALLHREHGLPTATTAAKPPLVRTASLWVKLSITAFTSLPVVLVGALGASSDVVLYATADRFARLLQLVATPFVQVAMYDVARNARDWTSARVVLSAHIKRLLPPLLGMLVVQAAIGPWLLDWVIGPHRGSAIVVLSFLLTAVSISIVSGLISNALLIPLGASLESARAYLVGFVMLMVVAVIVDAGIGGERIAVDVLCVQIVLLLMLLLTARRHRSDEACRP